MKRHCVINRSTGKVQRCFGSLGAARKFCARLNRLCGCRRFGLR